MAPKADPAGSSVRFFLRTYALGEGLAVDVYDLLMTFEDKDRMVFLVKDMAAGCTG